MKKKWLIATMAVILFWSLLGTGQVQAKSKYIIYVNRSSNIVNVVRRKNGKVVRSMWCSTGVGYATPSGTFYTGEKYRWRSLYHSSVGQYCTRISGHVLFHSVPAAGYSKTAVPTKAFNLLGKQASMGCVRLACKDARWIYNHCSYGTKVIIGESRRMKKPRYKRIKISTKKRYYWDPTDPDPSNPYRPTIRLSKEGKKEISLGSKFDIRNMVTVRSRIGSQKLLLKHIRMKGKVNTKKPGKYKVKVRVTDPKSELYREKKFTFKVSKKAAPVESTETVNPTEKDLPLQTNADDETADMKSPDHKKADTESTARKNKVAKAGPSSDEEIKEEVKTDGADLRIAKAKETIRQAREEIKKAKAEIKKARADQKKAAKKKAKAAKKKAKTKKKNKPAKKKDKAKKKNKPAKKKDKPAKKKSKAKKKDKPAKKKAK